MRRARQLGVERLQAPGRADEQPCGVADAALVERDLAPQVLDLRGLQRRIGPASAAVSSCRAASSAPASRFARAAASRRRTRSAGSGVSVAALSRKRGGRGDAPARLRAAGRALELLGDLLVGPGGRLGAVPCAPVGMGLGIGGLGERGVQRVALGRGCRAIRRRAHQRVAESDLRADLEQVGVDRRRRGVRIDAEPLGRPPHEQRLAHRIGRGELQQPPGVGRERVEPPPEAVLDAGRRPAAAGRRSRPPARPRSCRAAAPAGRADCRGSRRRSGRATRSSIRPGTTVSSSARASAVVEPAQPQLRQARQAAARRSARARRRRAPPTPRAAGARRTRAPARRRRRATGSRRRRRAAAAPRRRRTSGRAWPGRRGSGRERSPGARPSATLRATCWGSGSASSRSSIGAHSWCSPAYGSSISDSTPAIWRPGSPTPARRRGAGAPSCRRPPRRG